MKKVTLSTNQIINNPRLRKELATNSLYWFLHIYLGNYVYYPTADFQKEIIHIAEDQNIRNAFIVAFRGSAKSTISTLALPLWSIIGKHKKLYILIITQTQLQARLILANIRQELESNHLLIKDFGPFNTDTTGGEWNSNTLVISKLGIRISALSTGESIRGVRHSYTRPDLIICDDLEDLASVKNKDIRNQTYEWFTGEVIPVGDRNTKIIVIGNLLHEDSLMMKLKNGVAIGTLQGKFYSYPLVSSGGSITWPGKFPSLKAIEDERKRIGNDIAWYREYLLQILPPEDRIIKSEWIHYYDELPAHMAANCVGYVMSVDPAISQKQTADKTAILTGVIYKSKDLFRLYILPSIVNQRMDFPTTKEMIKNLSETINPKNKTTILIEKVAYQEALIQALQTEGYPAEGVDPHGQDKIARLRLVSSYVKTGSVYFPRYGSAELTNQLVNFGVERFDDLVDAFTMMVNQVFVDKSGGLTNQGPIVIKSTGLYSSNIYSKGEDWADIEDRQILRKYKGSRNWTRIIG